MKSKSGEKALKSWTENFVDLLLFSVQVQWKFLTGTESSKYGIEVKKTHSNCVKKEL